MEITEIVLLAAGGIIFILSFLIPDKKGEASEQSKELVKEEIADMVSREMESVRGQVDGVVEEAVTYAMEKTERSLERLSNEKIMAVNEYSDTVLAEIHKNHEEAMFLYDMLNNKHDNLKNTVSAVNRTVKEVEEKLSSFQEMTGMAGMPQKVAGMAGGPQERLTGRNTGEQAAVQPVRQQEFQPAAPAQPVAVPTAISRLQTMAQRSSAASSAASVPKASMPVASMPVASMPQASVSKASVPVASVPVASMPQASMPQASMSVNSTPRTTAGVSANRNAAASGTARPVSRPAASIPQNSMSVSSVHQTPMSAAPIPQTYNSASSMTQTSMSASFMPQGADSTDMSAAGRVSFLQEKDINGQNNNERILELHRLGKSKVAIAKELGLGVGEVKLVIDLFRNQ